MYFPIIRGRQFELQAIRESLKKNVLSEKVIPIVEPVKESKLLYDVVNLFIESKRKIAIIKNPIVGDYVFQKTIFKKDLFSKSTSFKDFLIDAFYVNDFLKNNSIEIEKNILICDADNDSDKTISILDECSNGRNAFKLLIPDTRAFRRLQYKNTVICNDYFKKRNRNADYAEHKDEEFSSDHLDYTRDSYVGFSDYSIIGKEYSESGFAPSAVAIHIVYFDDNKKLRVCHYVSDFKEGQRNTAKKYEQAVSKFVDWYEGINSLFRTMGGDALTNTYKQPKFPGLGKIKEYSLMHHFELISKFLDEKIK